MRIPVKFMNDGFRSLKTRKLKNVDAAFLKLPTMFNEKGDPRVTTSNVVRVIPIPRLPERRSKK